MLGYPFFRLLYMLGSISWFVTGILALTVLWNIAAAAANAGCP